jgi:hypothetical protein
MLTAAARLRPVSGSYPHPLRLLGANREPGRSVPTARQEQGTYMEARRGCRHFAESVRPRLCPPVGLAGLLYLCDPLFPLEAGRQPDRECGARPGLTSDRQVATECRGDPVADRQAQPRAVRGARLDATEFNKARSVALTARHSYPVRAPPATFMCCRSGGGMGRRARLKIEWPRGRAGSSPAPSTSPKGLPA